MKYQINIDYFNFENKIDDDDYSEHKKTFYNKYGLDVMKLQCMGCPHNFGEHDIDGACGYCEGCKEFKHFSFEMEIERIS